MTENRKRKRKVLDSSGQTCWTENDRNVLIRLVKQCQKLGSEGSSGEWKTFLKVSVCRFVQYIYQKCVGYDFRDVRSSVCVCRSSTQSFALRTLRSTIGRYSHLTTHTIPLNIAQWQRMCHGKFAANLQAVVKESWTLLCRFWRPLWTH
jgi:hypothetical protein